MQHYSPFELDAALGELASLLEGELCTDILARRSYATDASEYQELPLAVALPRSDADVGVLIRFAAANRIGLIPRGAGTSLAGQVVGSGIVVDLGRHLNRVLALDVEGRRVTVQPGVVRNELNRVLAPHGLMFAPETSTANRAMIGGMVGNNSCGSNSIAYGTTRDHLVRARGFLANGEEVTFGPLDQDEFLAKTADNDSLESRVYGEVDALLESSDNRAAITTNFPRVEVTRRNTGYALDRLMDCSAFDSDSRTPFNMCNLIAGSEGTLFIGVEFELACVPLPPPAALLCAHFNSIAEALQATLIVMQHRPTACELIDHRILECTRSNIEQSRNRFFIEGDPGAILVVEVCDEDPAVARERLEAIITELHVADLGTAFPVITGSDVERVWELRRAGQGLMANVAGDAKPREVVEDTAVALEDLPAYIAEFDRLLREQHGVDCIYYAHAGAGELHTRPLFNLREPAGLRRFRDIATDVAHLVRKYRGSLSGEHGDGRLRGEFIPFMVGSECFEMMRRIKDAFDPDGILNPGKIIDTPPMDSQLRVAPGDPDPSYVTVLDFGGDGGILRAAERCNGVGACRKSHLMGGTMCPSYMATGDERHTTRARANLMRQVLARRPEDGDPWLSGELEEVMDLCNSCKGCHSECPSNVDVARLKAEWLQQRHDRVGVPWRTRQMAHAGSTMRLASSVAPLYNFAVRMPLLSTAIKRVLGIATARSLPPVHHRTLRRWHARHANPEGTEYPNGEVLLFADEFTDTLDAPIGIAAVELLNQLGYRVVIPEHRDSGRARISTGMLREARELARANVSLLADRVSADLPLVGIEPSAILGFRDEYPDLVGGELRSRALALGQNALLIEEFLAREAASGRIKPESFDSTPRRLLLHGHCHQKALASTDEIVAALMIPTGHDVEVIPSGCCGMAGSFGYGSDHFEVSLGMGELVLLPAVRSAGPDEIVVTAGTSCRHQIVDATGRRALHPVEVLRGALARAG